MLAVLYGDGRLEILAVPEPASLASNIDPRLSNARSGTQMLVRLKPVLTTPPDSISSLGSCIEWLPIAPHDLLLVRLSSHRLLQNQMKIFMLLQQGHESPYTDGTLVFE